MIGGITYTEIEGIRYLNRKLSEMYEKKQRSTKTQIIIVTTSIINSKRIFKYLGKNFQNDYTLKEFFEQSKKMEEEKKNKKKK